MPFLCERCGEAVPNADYVYEGAVVCGECYEEIEDIETVSKYIEDYPNVLKDYITETLNCTDPYRERLVEVLLDIKHWSDTCSNPDESYMRFSDWVMRWH